MFSIDTAHVPHVYSFGAVGLVLLSALVLYVIELRRVGSTPWSERYTDRVVPLYRAPQRSTPIAMRVTHPQRPTRDNHRTSAAYLRTVRPRNR